MIDVIIPLFNKEKKIIRCLKSVVFQTYLPKNIIVVDDGSTDDSLKNAKKTLEHYSGDYQVISKMNEGVSSARNTGLSLAVSSYVAFLDADDFWDGSYLEKAVNILNEIPDIKVLSFFHRVKKGNKFFKPNQGVPRHFSGFLRSYSLAAKKGNPVNSSKIVINRELLGKIGGFPEGAGLTEDLYVWLRLSMITQIFIHNEFLVTVDKGDDPSRPSRLCMQPYVLSYFLQPSVFCCLNNNDSNYLRHVYLVQSLYAIRYGSREDSLKRIKLGSAFFPFFATGLHFVRLIASAFRRN